MATKSGRTIGYEKKRSLKTVLLRWETLLILIFLAVNVVNYLMNKKIYLNMVTTFNHINNYMCIGLIALPVAYILLLGDIDLSVGSIFCLSATMLGVVFNATGSIWLGIVACLAAGTVCGLINGLVMTRFTELAPMIVTLATSILFRGISEGILGTGSTGGMQKIAWFKSLYHGRIVGFIPYAFVLFCVLAVIFGLVMHKTIFGRHMFAIGANKLAAKYAGVRVQKVRLIVYTLTGLICAVAGIFYSANTGSVKSNIGTGYDIETISMCVLGGISTAGGKGTLLGAVIAIFTVVLLRYGLLLANVPDPYIKVVVGALLIVVVLLPNLNIKGLLKKKA